MNKVKTSPNFNNDRYKNKFISKSERIGEIER